MKYDENIYLYPQKDSIYFCIPVDVFENIFMNVEINISIILTHIAFYRTISVYHVLLFLYISSGIYH